MPGGVGGDLFIALLRINAIGLDVFLDADMLDRIGIGIGIGQMGTVARVGLDENDFGVHFQAGADRFGERIAGFDRNVDAALFVLSDRDKE